MGLVLVAVVDDDLRTDEHVPEDDDLPDRLDVPIDKPVEDVIESLQSAGDDSDEYEPHA